MAVTIYVVINVINNNKPINEKLSKNGYRIIYNNYINRTDENGVCYDEKDYSKQIKCERIYDEVEYQGKTSDVKSVPAVFLIDKENKVVASYYDETFAKASNNKVFSRDDEEGYKKLLNKTHTSEDEIRMYLKNELNKVYKVNTEIEYFNNSPVLIYNTFIEDMNNNGWTLSSDSNSFISFSKGDTNLAVLIENDRVKFITYDTDNQRKSIFDRLDYVYGSIMKYNYIDVDCAEVLDSGEVGYYYTDGSTCNGRLDSLYQEYLNFYNTVLTRREFRWLYGYIYFN